MRTIIILCLMAFSMMANAQTVEDKMKLALKLQNEKEYGKSNKQLLDLYSTNDLKELVCLNLAKNYLAIGNYKNAEKYAYECVLQKGEYDKDASIILGNVYHQDGKIEEEEKLYLEMLAKYPKNYNLNLYLSMLYSEQSNKANLTGKCFYKTIKCDPLNRYGHYVLAHYEEQSRHYIQSILSYYFQLMISPHENGVKKIQKLIDSNRNVTDALQESLYDQSEEVSETDMQLYWAMAFLPEYSGCERDEETQLPDAECFIENSRELIIKICESATCNRVEEERTHSDFYLDFFQNLLKNDLLDEFLYYTLFKTYPDIMYYFDEMSSDRLMEFANFLEKYFE